MQMTHVVLVCRITEFPSGGLVSSSVAAQPNTTTSQTSGLDNCGASGGNCNSISASSSDPVDVTPEPREPTNDDEAAPTPKQQRKAHTRKGMPADGEQPGAPDPRPRQRRQGTSSFRLVGDAQYPLSKWSLTVTRTKQDVPGYLLDVFFAWIEKFCVRGLISTEVGHRAFHLHLQGIFECRFPATDKAVIEVREFL
jgi:hypothetical protein